MLVSQLKTPQLWLWCAQMHEVFGTLTLLFPFFFRCLYNSDGDFLIGELMLWLLFLSRWFYLGYHLPASLFFQNLGLYSQDLEERVGFTPMPCRFGGLAPALLLCQTSAF